MKQADTGRKEGKEGNVRGINSGLNSAATLCCVLWSPKPTKTNQNQTKGSLKKLNRNSKSCYGNTFGPDLTNQREKQQNQSTQIPWQHPWIMAAPALIAALHLISSDHGNRGSLNQPFQEGIQREGSAGAQTHIWKRVKWFLGCSVPAVLYAALITPPTPHPRHQRPAPTQLAEVTDRAWMRRVR